MTLCLTVVLLLCVGTVGARQYRLGMLHPYRHIRLGWDMTTAAATMAVEKAQHDGLLQDFSVKLLYRDDQCSAKQAAGLAVIMNAEEEIDVYIGPPCSACAIPVGYLASFWNIPMFTWAGTDPVLSDKSTFSTLVRIQAPYSRMGSAFYDIFTYFGWQRIVMVSQIRYGQIDVFCDYASRSVDERFRDGNITVSDWMRVEKGLSDRKIDDVLMRIQQRGRIVILCVPPPDEHQILRAAMSRGMTNGDFIFFTIHNMPPDNIATPWSTPDGDFIDLLPAYRVIIQVSLSSLSSPGVRDFRQRVMHRMAGPPWNHSQPLQDGKIASIYAPFMHDLVYLYLMTLNQTLETGSDPRDGVSMFQQAIAMTFQGVTGGVAIDKNGDRNPNYWLWTLHDNQRFQPWVEVRMSAPAMKRMVIMGPVPWLTDDGQPPPDTPPCGFYDEHCPPDTTGRDVLIGLTTGLAALILLSYLACLPYQKHKKIEDEIKSMRWRVHYPDIKLAGNGGHAQSQMSLVQSMMSMMSGMSEDAHASRRLQVGTYNGVMVSLETLCTQQVILLRPDHLELNTMWQLGHDNLNRFMGFSMDEPHITVLMTYCSRGSLQDILGNEDIHLDFVFKSSLLMDLAKAMVYLHGSSLHYHGVLTSETCLVDNRWILKVSGYGLRRIRHLAEQTDGDGKNYSQYREMLWTAPEVLRESMWRRVLDGTKTGDVYSYGIIMNEMFTRSMPYAELDAEPDEIVSRIVKGEEPVVRPATDTENEEKEVEGLQDMMRKCWDENPDVRPNFNEIKRSLIKLNKGKKTNIMDNLLDMMEKYANNLEDIVKERTKDLVEEKKKTDMLLYSMLPRSIADELKVAGRVAPERFDDVTIFFSDIVGFTALSSQSTPFQVVDLLNALYTTFDAIIGLHDVYKVETIGDAYMVVSGLPEKNGNRHAGEIANMALDLLSATLSFEIPHRPGMQLKLRIGLHSGACVAGVVGLTMPRYCLFGDAVNTASRMESNGKALKIHISMDNKACLDELVGYQTVVRGEVEMKGKGLQTTYWLVGKDGYTKPLPAADD